MADPAWPELVDEFTADLEDEERSAHTVRNYRDDLAAFATWFRGQRGEEPQLAILTKRDVNEWIGSIEATGGRRGARAELPTVNRKLAALRSFFRWAQGQDIGVRFDAPKPRRRQSKPDPRWLSKAEERALIAAVEAADSRRDVAVLWLGLHGGLRVAEMQGLDCSDIAISERKGEMVVRGKGRKQRVVKLSKTLRHALLELGVGRRSGPVLVGQRGRLSIRGLQDIAARYGAAAKLGKTAYGIEGFSIHALRHTCARRMLDAGVPITDVAAHLGHSDIKTTMAYVASREENLARAAEALDG